MVHNFVRLVKPAYEKINEIIVVIIIIIITLFIRPLSFLDYGEHIIYHHKNFHYYAYSGCIII
jgi:hypothetical protein